MQAQILDQDRRLDPPAQVEPVGRPRPLAAEAGAAVVGMALEAPSDLRSADSWDLAQPSTLIGRAAELRLHKVLGEVLPGGGSRFVVLNGEPGIGETTLAQALLEHAAGPAG